MKPRVAIWTAVSSKDQAADDKTSLQDQEKMGRTYTEEVEGDVVRIYTVPGHTRDIVFYEEAADAMDAYRDLRADCKAGEFDTLWIFDPDRVGRDPALAQTVASMIIKSGHEIYVENGHYRVNSDESVARFMFSFQATSAGEDQKKRIKRHHHGIRGRVRRGLHPAIWPHGYRAVRDVKGKVVRGEFVDDEVEAVRLITELFLNGDGYLTIASALDRSPWRPRRADHWNHQTIRAIINNDFYAGYVVYGRGSDNVVQSERSDKFPHVWDDETYRAVLRERERRYRGGSPPATPLTGCVYCARCGVKMVSVRHGYSGRRFYKCKTYTQAMGQECHYNSIYFDDLADAVDAKLAEWRAIGADKVAELMAADTRLKEDMEREREKWKQAVALIERQQDKLTDAVLKDMVDERSARRKNQQLKEQLSAALAALSDVEREIAALPDVEDMRNRVEDMLGEVTSVRDRELEAIRRKLLDCNLQVFVENGEIVGEIEVS